MEKDFYAASLEMILPLISENDFPVSYHWIQQTFQMLKGSEEKGKPYTLEQAITSLVDPLLQLENRINAIEQRIGDRSNGN